MVSELGSWEKLWPSGCGNLVTRLILLILFIIESLAQTVGYPTLHVHILYSTI